MGTDLTATVVLDSARQLQTIYAARQAGTDTPRLQLRTLLKTSTPIPCPLNRTTVTQAFFSGVFAGPLLFPLSATVVIFG